MATTYVLVSNHAEDVGGTIVEPGQPLPDDADADTVKRLKDEGKLGKPPDDSDDDTSARRGTK